jgi:hypothetical protein
VANVVSPMEIAEEAQRLLSRTNHVTKVDPDVLSNFNFVGRMMANIPGEFFASISSAVAKHFADNELKLGKAVHSRICAIGLISLCWRLNDDFRFFRRGFIESVHAPGVVSGMVQDVLKGIPGLKLKCADFVEITRLFSSKPCRKGSTADEFGKWPTAEDIEATYPCLHALFETLRTGYNKRDATDAEIPDSSRSRKRRRRTATQIETRIEPQIYDQFESAAEGNEESDADAGAES